MIHRIDVRSVERSSLAAAVQKHLVAAGANPGEVAFSRIFLIDSDASPEQIRRVATELLTDPVVESFDLAPASAGARIEIHLKPGVMDPVAESTEQAIREMGVPVRSVRTGRAFLTERKTDATLLKAVAERYLANSVIENVHFEPYVPKEFPRLSPQPFQLRHVPIRELSEEQLKRLSREGHLFLSLAEMRAIQSYYRELSREPTDIELETLAQTWSEHCVHKTLKSAVEVVDKSGKVLRRYSNLIKETIFAATQQLMTQGRPSTSDASAATVNPPADFCLSVFKDNAGVIAFDDTDAVCFKVETHNHPSAIEPYGGSATGVGGVIRDVLGTGLGARPIANTDVFCVAPPDMTELPRGVIHPRRVLEQVVAGVRDYGNRMGIPTVNGAVYFDADYVGNPLVFCGCVGIIPRDKIAKSAVAGDAIVVIGGRTGRDGIHGATFSSAELTDTHADEFSHAVQIGNAITEKKVLDVILQARDRGLFTAITDCGAGGLSSAVGEMGADIGATVELDRVPLKYDGLRYDEIWISEAQERMVVSVPMHHVESLLKLCALENVEATAIGTFGNDSRELILRYKSTEVGRMSMEFLHDGIPMPTRTAVVPEPLGLRNRRSIEVGDSRDLRQKLLKLLSHPNIASKHWIIRQYDHEVQAGSAGKPLVGPLQRGPSDAAILRPKFKSFKGVAVACGLAPWIDDPYDMALCAIDEAVRNIVAVGGRLQTTAILDNFCWPSVDDDVTMGTLVRACEGCRDGALAYGIPFISGKDSLHNQFVNQETRQVIRIPRTLLISAISVLDDVRSCVTMDFKDPRDGVIYLVSPLSQNIQDRVATHRATSAAIAKGLVNACHDVSEGGWLVSVAEMCIGSGMGARLSRDDAQTFFDEFLGGYVVEVHQLGASAFQELMRSRGADTRELGRVSAQPTLEISSLSPDRSLKYDLHVGVDELFSAWSGPLDW